jgi:hypothetical protein
MEPKVPRKGTNVAVGKVGKLPGKRNNGRVSLTTLEMSRHGVFLGGGAGDDLRTPLLLVLIND